MARKFNRGHLPDNDWEKIGEVESDCGEKFFIFILREDNEWIKVRVNSIKKVKGRANYWLSFNGDRFSYGSDYYSILESRGSMCLSILQWENL